MTGYLQQNDRSFVHVTMGVILFAGYIGFDISKKPYIHLPISLNCKRGCFWKKWGVKSVEIIPRHEVKNVEIITDLVPCHHSVTNPLLPTKLKALACRVGLLRLSYRILECRKTHFEATHSLKSVFWVQKNNPVRSCF